VNFACLLGNDLMLTHPSVSGKAMYA